MKKIILILAYFVSLSVVTCVEARVYRECLYSYPDERAYSMLDMMADSITWGESLEYIPSAAIEGFIAETKGLFASSELIKYKINTTLLSKKGQKKAKDIEKKLALWGQVGLSQEDYTFLNSKEGSMYRDSKDALNKAQHILARDIPLWLAINHAALDNSINEIIKTFKIRGLGTVVQKSISSIITNLPELIVAAVYSLPLTFLTLEHYRTDCTSGFRRKNVDYNY